MAFNFERALSQKAHNQDRALANEEFDAMTRRIIALKPQPPGNGGGGADTSRPSFDEGPFGHKAMNAAQQAREGERAALRASAAPAASPLPGAASTGQSFASMAQPATSAKPMSTLSAPSVSPLRGSYVPLSGALPESSGLFGTSFETQSQLPEPMRRGKTFVKDKKGRGNPKKDTVNAKLAEGEAVLNAHAAESLGRDVIAALNARGAKAMGLRGSARMKGGKLHAAEGYAPAPGEWDELQAMKAAGKNVQIDERPYYDQMSNSDLALRTVPEMLMPIGAGLGLHSGDAEAGVFGAVKAGVRGASALGTLGKRAVKGVKGLFGKEADDAATKANDKWAKYDAPTANFTERAPVNGAKVGGKYDHPARLDYSQSPRTDAAKALIKDGKNAESGLPRLVGKEKMGPINTFVRKHPYISAGVPIAGAAALMGGSDEQSAPTAEQAQSAPTAQPTPEQVAAQAAQQSALRDRAAYSEFFNKAGITDAQREAAPAYDSGKYKGGLGRLKLDNSTDQIYRQGNTYTGMGAPSRVEAELAKANDPAVKKEAMMVSLRNAAMTGDKQAMAMYNAHLQADSYANTAAQGVEQERIKANKAGGDDRVKENLKAVDEATQRLREANKDNPQAGLAASRGLEAVLASEPYASLLPNLKPEHARVLIAQAQRDNDKMQNFNQGTDDTLFRTDPITSGESLRQAAANTAHMNPLRLDKVWSNEGISGWDWLRTLKPSNLGSWDSKDLEYQTAPNRESVMTRNLGESVEESRNNKDYQKNLKVLADAGLSGPTLEAAAHAAASGIPVDAIMNGLRTANRR